MAVDKRQITENILAKWLQKVRIEKGISQDALGVQLEKGQSDIAKIENGSKKVTVFELLIWIDALDVPYERLNEVLKSMFESIIDKSKFWDI